jgi:hypothetical protein
MKEDTLEQLVDDYLQLDGFVYEFHPAKGDPDHIVAQNCIPSDVEVVGFHPPRLLRKGPDRVWIVSCKKLAGKIQPGRMDHIDRENRTVAASQIGRLLQMIKASGWKP